MSNGKNVGNSEILEELKEMRKELAEIREKLEKKEDEDIIEILVSYSSRSGNGYFDKKVRRDDKIKLLRLKICENVNRMVGNGEFYFCKPDRKDLDSDSKFSDHNIEQGDTIVFREFR